MCIRLKTSHPLSNICGFAHFNQPRVACKILPRSKGIADLYWNSNDSGAGANICEGLYWVNVWHVHYQPQYKSEEYQTKTPRTLLIILLPPKVSTAQLLSNKQFTMIKGIAQVYIYTFLIPWCCHKFPLTLAWSCSCVEPSLAFDTWPTSTHQRVTWPEL